MIKTIYVLRISFPITCLRLDSHLAASFLLPSPPGPSRKRTPSTLQHKHLHTELIPVLLRAHTEQHQKNFLPTWILNASSPGDLTTPIYWRIIRYVPDYFVTINILYVFCTPECSLYVGQIYCKNNDNSNQ
ncbi:hypothetical protein ILYODFUR_035927 [Ilyodon furcidens]|uniref:Uncharacterized protein n=1 Tax=Ilyodon furcidens TaxID=33524 RepID=A0ABV0VMB5_9TELE